MKYTSLIRSMLGGFAACMLLLATSFATPFTSYSSSLSFGATQGTHGWRWQYSPVGDTNYYDYNSFLSNSWSKDSLYNWNWGVFHSHKRMQPGINADLVAEFTAPSAGTLKIFSRTPARITDTYNSLDGVRIKILKNNTQLWPESDWETVTLGREVNVPEMRIQVAASDKIRFRINCAANGESDQLNWEFDVAYEDLPESGVYTPAQSYGSTQGNDGWRWQNTPASLGDTTAPVDFNAYLSKCWWRDTKNNWSQGAFIKSYRMQPGSSGDVVTTFTCPDEGELDIQTRAPVRITPGFPSTDGVRIKILKNDVQLWPESGWCEVGSNTEVIVPTVRTQVVPGDKIHFKVNCNTSGVADDTTWHFGVAYAAIYLSGATLQEDILSEYAANAAKYVIPAGVYKVPHNPNTPAHLNFVGLENFEIDGTGVRLLFEGTATGLRFENCDNVIIRGLTTDYAKLSHAQGAIIDRSDTSITVHMDKGYPTDFTTNTRFPAEPTGYVYDSTTLKLKPGTSDYYGTGFTLTESGDIMITVPAVESSVAIGDLMAFRSLCGIATVLSGCKNMHLFDVTVHGGSFALLESNGDGPNFYDNYRVAYGPTPLGATRPRLLSTFADALHSGNMRTGPNLDGCVFTGMGDDGINIHGIYGMVMSIESTTSFIVGYESKNPILNGDHIRALGRDLTTRATRTTTSTAVLQENYTPASASWYAAFAPTYYYLFTVNDGIPNLAVGDWIANPDSSGSGFTISNSVFRNNRARGVLVKAENGTIENSVFDGNSMHSILVSPELAWAESGHAAHLTISNNKFRNAGYYGSGRPAVRIDGETAKGHYDIKLLGNTFDQNYYTDLSIRSGTDFTLEDNTFGQRNSAVIGTPAYTEPHVMLANLETLGMSRNSFSSGRVAVVAESSATGITGTPTPANAFSASTAFTSTQGNQGWWWENVVIDTNTYTSLDLHLNGAWWSNTSNNWPAGMIRATRLQPGSTYDVSRTFIAPYAGTATLRSLGPITVNYTGSDGVQVKILKNNTQIWPATGWVSVLPGSPIRPPDQVVPVQSGDALHFRVNVKGTAVYDDVTWQPTIYLLP